MKRLLNPSHILTRRGVKQFWGSGKPPFELLMQSGPIGPERNQIWISQWVGVWSSFISLSSSPHSSHHLPVLIHFTIFQSSFFCAGTKLPYISFFSKKEITEGTGKSAAYNMLYWCDVHIYCLPMDKVIEITGSFRMYKLKVIYPLY